MIGEGELTEPLGRRRVRMEAGANLASGDDGAVAGGGDDDDRHRARDRAEKRGSELPAANRADDGEDEGRTNDTAVEPKTGPLLTKSACQAKKPQ